MNKLTRCATDVTDRAVRTVLEHWDEYPSQRSANESVAGKIGFKAERLRQGLRQAERDAAVRAGSIAIETERIKQLERENRELRQANQILQWPSEFLYRRSSTVTPPTEG